MDAHIVAKGSESARRVVVRWRGQPYDPIPRSQNGKRYRHYISNNLIAGTNKSRETNSGVGLRIAAQEIEGHVITAIATLLADPQRVLAELCPDDAAPAAITTALRQARLLGEALTAESARQKGTPVYARYK